MIKKPIVFLVLVIFGLGLVAGQESDFPTEDELFGGGGDDTNDDPFADPFGDDMFGSDSMIEDLGDPDDPDSVSASGGTGGQDAFTSLLVSDQVQIGGRVSGSMSSLWGWTKYPGSWNAFTGDGYDRMGFALSADLYVDARPASNFRFFSKIRTAYPFTSGIVAQDPDNDPISINQLNLQVRELYSDVTFDDSLFLRFGKQTVTWGVARFFSPADIISLTPIDVENPDEEREGPVALKVNLPVGLHSFDAYLIGDERVKSFRDLGLATRAEFFLAPVEWGLGVGWQQDRPLSLVTTLRMPWRDWSFFGEGRVNFGRAEQRLTSTGGLVDDDGTYFSGTGGFFYTNTDAKFNAWVQYYYQGEGYDDSVSFQSAIGKLPFSVLTAFGKHHTILSLGLTELFHEDLSASALWQAAWSDMSGLISTSLNWNVFDGLGLSGSVYAAYGDNGTELGNISVRNQVGRLGFSLTADIGSGRF